MVGVGIRGTDNEVLYNERDRRKNRFPEKGSDSEGDGLTGAGDGLTMLHCSLPETLTLSFPKS